MFRSRRLAISLLLSAYRLCAAAAGALAASHGLSGRGSVTAAPASSGQSPVKVARVGTFGVVVRPERTRQLTYRRRPLYTYVNDKKPGQVLCDGVNGWFVFRVSARGSA